MRVVIATEHRFARAEDGSVYSQTGGREYRFWARYLTVFDEVALLARVETARQLYPRESLASGPNVVFYELPTKLRPLDYLSLGYLLRRRVAEVGIAGSACILRVPGLVSSLLAPRLFQSNYPYGVEVVGDPYDVFAPRALQHPIRPVVRFLFTRWMQTQCARAAAAAYVTRSALQQRYPPRPDAFHSYYSSVDLPEQAFVDQPRVYKKTAQEMRLISVGTMAQMYKGFDVLIEAVAISLKKGARISLTLVGDGRYRDRLRQQVEQLGLADHVTFTGQLPSGDAIRAKLDQSDLFVLASRTEGLPRALLEAMARGLPSIATDVGGVPELLPRACIVPPDDAQALSRKILELVANSDYLSQLSSRNLQKAREFEERVLNLRRRQFYKHVRTMTEEWLQCNNP